MTEHRRIALIVSILPLWLVARFVVSYHGQITSPDFTGATLQEQAPSLLLPTPGSVADGGPRTAEDRRELAATVAWQDPVVQTTADDGDATEFSQPLALIEVDQARSARRDAEYPTLPIGLNWEMITKNGLMVPPSDRSVPEQVAEAEAPVPAKDFSITEDMPTEVDAAATSEVSPLPTQTTITVGKSNSADTSKLTSGKSDLTFKQIAGEAANQKSSPSVAAVIKAPKQNEASAPKTIVRERVMGSIRRSDSPRDTTSNSVAIRSVKVDAVTVKPVMVKPSPVDTKTVAPAAAAELAIEPSVPTAPTVAVVVPVPATPSTSMPLIASSPTIANTEIPKVAPSPLSIVRSPVVTDPVPQPEFEIQPKTMAPTTSSASPASVPAPPSAAVVATSPRAPAPPTALAQIPTQRPARAMAPLTSEQLVQRATAGAIPTGSPTYSARANMAELYAVARMADSHSKRGFDLASRGALFSARAEFVRALGMIAQGLDSLEHGTAHVQAMNDGLQALEESNDFVAETTQLTTTFDAVVIARPHFTPVLKNREPGKTSAMQALQEYYSYAQRQFIFAAGHQPPGSMALHGLGKTYVVLGKAKSRQALAAEPKAIVFFQSALLTDPRNFMAANELGVLLSNYGKFDQAKAAFVQSLHISSQPVAWRNLAYVHNQLGESELARLAQHEAESAARRGSDKQPGPLGLSTRTHNVEWVDPATFARTGETPGMTPDKPAERAALVAPTGGTSARRR